MHLIVKVPFHGHEIGDRITEAEKIAAILSGELAHLESFCTRIAKDAHGWVAPVAPVVPAPAPIPAPAPAAPTSPPTPAPAANVPAV